MDRAQVEDPVCQKVRERCGDFRRKEEGPQLQLRINVFNIFQDLRILCQLPVKTNVLTAQ